MREKKRLFDGAPNGQWLRNITKTTTTKHADPLNKVMIDSNQNKNKNKSLVKETK